MKLKLSVPTATRKKGNVSPQDNWPIVIEATLFWVDERVRTPVRRKVKVGKPLSPAVVSCPRGTIFRPGTASFESRNHNEVLRWILARKSEGWITLADLQERQQFIRIVMRSKGTGKIDPAGWANKPSGKAMPGSRKPVRDYKKTTCHGGHNA